jgi:hypothetical protein
MRRMAIAVAGITMIVGLAAPAWAADSSRDRPSRFHSASNDPPGEGRSHYDRPENSDRGDDEGEPQRFHSASSDRPGEGNAHYDREHHDDPAL